MEVISLQQQWKCRPTGHPGAMKSKPDKETEEAVKGTMNVGDCMLDDRGHGPSWCISSAVVIKEN